jgi:hypothetical protein
MLSHVPLPLFVLLFALLAVVFYLSAVLYQTRAENTSTRRLRLVVFLSGLALFYTGALFAWFDVPWRGRAYALARPYSAADDFLYWVFMFTGIVMLVSSPLWSRKKLVREARHLADAGDDFGLSDDDVVTPAERVDALRKRTRRRAVGDSPEKPV